MRMPMSAQVTMLPGNQFDHLYRGGNHIGELRCVAGGPSAPDAPANAR
jgi:hypothetical protein